MNVADIISPEKAARMRYNVFALLPGQTVVKAFPELSLVAELTYCNDEVLRYIIMLYSPESPLLEIDDVGNRKLIAGELAGIAPFKELQNRINEFDQGMDDAFKVAVGAWFRRLNHSLFERVVSLEEFIHNQLEIGRTKINFEVSKMEDDKLVRANKIIGDCMKQALVMGEELEKLKEKFIVSQKERFGEVIIKEISKSSNALHNRAKKKREKNAPPGQREEFMSDTRAIEELHQVQPVSEIEIAEEETRNQHIPPQPELEDKPPVPVRRFGQRN